MHHQVMDLQDEAVQPYEGGKGTIEEVHPDRTRRKNIIKPKKTSSTKRTTGWNWTTDIIISSTTGEVFLPSAKVRTPSGNQAPYPDLALAGLILRTFDRSDKVNIDMAEPL